MKENNKKGIINSFKQLWKPKQNSKKECAKKSTSINNAKNIDINNKNGKSKDKKVFTISHGKIIFTIIITALFFFIFSKTLFAASPWDTISSAIGGLLNGMLGVLLYVLTIPVMIIYTVIFLVLSMFVTGGIKFLTPGVIFTNGVPVTNLMLFLNPSIADETGLGPFAQTVSTWFWVIFLLSISLEFIVLIYLSIKMLWASKSGDSMGIAMIKTKLTNWIVSVILLNGMVFFCIGMIGISNIFVEVLSKSIPGAVLEGELGQLFLNLLIPNAISMISSIIAIGMILRLTLQYLGAYIKRVIKVGFLIIISPLIAVTYSIDLFKDKKAQTLNSWAKEYLGLVFIQPFHLILYVIIANFVSSITSPSWFGLNLPKLLLTIIALRFMGEAEELLKKFFQLERGTSLKDSGNFGKLLLLKQLISRAKPKRESSKVDKSGNIPKVESSTTLADRTKAPTVGASPEENKQSIGGGDGTANKTVVGRANAQEQERPTVLDKRDSETLSTAIEDVKETTSKKEKLKGLGKKWVSYAPAVAAGTVAMSMEMTEGLGGALAFGAAAYKGVDFLEGKAKKRRTKKEIAQNLGNSAEQATNEVATKTKEALALAGIDGNTNTASGTANVQLFLDQIKDDMDTGKLKASFEANLNDFVNHLHEKSGLTLAAARLEAQRLLAGQTTMDEIGDKYGLGAKEHARNLAVEQKRAEIAGSMNSFNVENEPINVDFSVFEDQVYEKLRELEANPAPQGMPSPRAKAGRSKPNVPGPEAEPVPEQIQPSGETVTQPIIDQPKYQQKAAPATQQEFEQMPSNPSYDADEWIPEPEKPKEEKPKEEKKKEKKAKTEIPKPKKKPIMPKPKNNNKE